MGRKAAQQDENSYEGPLTAEGSQRGVLVANGGHEERLAPRSAQDEASAAQKTQEEAFADCASDVTVHVRCICGNQAAQQPETSYEGPLTAEGEVPVANESQEERVIPMIALEEASATQKSQEALADCASDVRVHVCCIGGNEACVLMAHIQDSVVEV